MNYNKWAAGLAGILALTVSGAASAQELLQSCVAELNRGTIAANFTFPNGSYNRWFSIPVSANPSAQTCSSYSWARTSSSSMAFGTGPQWAGRSTTSAWDCNHSSIEYALYGKAFLRSWTMIGGGMLWGKLVNGQCTYSVSNFPGGWGKDTAVGVLPPYAQYAVAVKSWSHNDPNLGHPGTDCGAASCYWPTNLFVTRR